MLPGVSKEFGESNTWFSEGHSDEQELEVESSLTFEQAEER
jgi:hypothetical protein